MTSLESNPQTMAWLTQFSLGDRLLARKLLEAFTLVSRDDFIEHMRAMLICEAERVDGKIALYAERELKHRFGVPHRLFKEHKRVVRRACGAAGPEAVKPTKSYDPSVGSEGIVAQMISELCHEYPKRFLNHPGPDQIRRERARAFWVVTDLIGSGDRARNYLEAAWLVRSVRSWWSGKLMRFAVMAYAATEAGERNVASHRCSPKIHFVLPCPTIDSMFNAKLADEMKKLCTAYDPTIGEPGLAPWKWSGPSLGYAAGGALIAFAHGAPNNIPLMFYKASKAKKKAWTPLFPARVSAGIGKDAFGIDLSAEKIQARLEKLGQRSLASSSAILKSDIPTAQAFFVLGALSRSSRLNDRALASRTGLPLHQLNMLLRKMISYGWVDSQRRLTDGGAGQLAHARKQLQGTMNIMPVGSLQQEPYYPTSLRQPI